MFLVIDISTEDFQIRWNVLSLSFRERESGKRPKQKPLIIVYLDISENRD